MRALIVLRQSPDWLNGFDPVAFERLIRRPEGSVSDGIRRWNERFKLSFSTVRHRLKEITLESLSATGLPYITMDEYLHRPPDPDTLYLFTDDDDWYSPHIAEHLHDADILVWGSVRFRGGFDFRPIKPFCYTNNYAIGGGWSSQPTKRPGTDSGRSS